MSSTASQRQEQKKTPLLQVELKKDYLVTWNRFQVDQEWVEAKYSESTKPLEGVVFEPGVPPPQTV